MTTTYVAVDVETTGLDARSDHIIEIGIVVFREGEVIEAYETLINPRTKLSAFITDLTGITQEMVDDAPSIFSVRSQIRRLMADHIVVGHNVGFDMGFLEESGLAHGQHRIDTVTLASILVPETGRFGLEALARFFDLPLPTGKQTHRALDDAHLTVGLFHVLKARASRLSFPQLEEIVEAGKRLNWPETIFFEDRLVELGRTAFGQRANRPRKLFDPERRNVAPPVAKEEPEPIDLQIVVDMLHPEGNFGRQFPDYEYRQEQVDMLVAVGEALNSGEHLLVEAGTGTGKSVGYLLPAAFWATQNGRRVLISTATITLQDQLINKDIPELARILPFELRAAILKGKRNYICTRLFQQLRHRGPKDRDEMTLFARVLAWLPYSNHGDVAEIALRTPAERMLWGRLSADNDVCNRETCAAEGCPLGTARRRAEESHIIVVNHALLLANVGHKFLPEHSDIIVDEAHHLESAVTDGLSLRVDKRFLDAILDDLRGTSGLIGDIESRTRVLPPDFRASLDSYIEAIRSASNRALMLVTQLFEHIDYFMDENIQRRSQFAQSVRLVKGMRTLPRWNEVEVTWEPLRHLLKRIGEAMDNIGRGLEELSENFDIDDVETLVLSIRNSERDLSGLNRDLNGIIANPKNDMIYWVELFRDRISMNAAPLHVGPLTEQHLFDEMECIVLASATMRTAGPATKGAATFDYIRDRLHAFKANELAVGSPFDYENRALLFLATDIPEPNQPGYQRYVEDAIVDVATALGGRTMVLFTSYGQLNTTAKAVEERLHDAGISMLAQRDGQSRQQILASFKAPDARSVLLGTRSFWEGVDVPGEALQAVLIVKIPFDVPSDPIFAARAETFDNSFMDYSIPEAVLRFRQGFGRLIRRGTDQGVVAILDKRVLTKRYGQSFLASLPEPYVLRMRTDRLGEAARRWLDREG